jgi:hypothetical protein
MERESDPKATGKRPYQKPELTQVSLRPEEAVLGSCKTKSSSGPGQGTCRAPAVCSTVGS